MGKRKDSKLDRTEPQVNSNNCGAMEQTAELGDLVREGDGDARTNGGTKDDAVDEDEAAEQAFASLDALPEVPEGEGAGPEDDGMGDIDGTAAAADAISEAPSDAVVDTHNPTAADSSQTWDEGSTPDETFWADGTDWAEAATSLSGEETLVREEANAEEDVYAGEVFGAEDELEADMDTGSEADTDSETEADTEVDGDSALSPAAIAEAYAPKFAAHVDDDPSGARAALASLSTGNTGVAESPLSPESTTEDVDAAAQDRPEVDLGETHLGSIPVDETSVIPHASDRPDSSRKARRAAKYYYPKYYQPSKFGRIPYVVAIVILALAVIGLGIATAWYSGAIAQYTGYGSQDAGIATNPDTGSQYFQGHIAIAQGNDGTTYQDLLYVDASADGQATVFYRGNFLSGRLVQTASDQDTVTFELQGTATQGGDTISGAKFTLSLPTGIAAGNVCGSWRVSLVTDDQKLSNWGTIKDDGTATANATDQYDIFDPGKHSTRESYSYSWEQQGDKFLLSPKYAKSYYTFKVWM